MSTDTLEATEPALEDAEAVILYIDPSSSTCGACGRFCDPVEKTHATILGHRWGPGCGARYTHVGSNYSYATVEHAARALRPDLIWYGGMS